MLVHHSHFHQENVTNLRDRLVSDRLCIRKQKMADEEFIFNKFQMYFKA